MTFGEASLYENPREELISSNKSGLEVAAGSTSEGKPLIVAMVMTSSWSICYCGWKTATNMNMIVWWKSSWVTISGFNVMSKQHFILYFVSWVTIATAYPPHCCNSLIKWISFIIHLGHYHSTLLCKRFIGWMEEYVGSHAYVLLLCRNCKIMVYASFARCTSGELSVFTPDYILYHITSLSKHFIGWTAE